MTVEATEPQPGTRQPGSAAVRCENLVHVYGTPGNEVAALRGVDLVLWPGEMIALLGPSGAGKTTLLWHLAGLLKPTAGIVEVAGRPLSALSARTLAGLRLREVGLLLQNPASNLLPGYTAFGKGKVLVDPSAAHLMASDVIDYITAKKTLDVKVDGRITLKK